MTKFRVKKPIEMPNDTSKLIGKKGVKFDS